MRSAPHLHRRIREDIEARIMSGEWPPGHRVPFEHELMAQYGCSRMTVNKVLSALAGNGLITRRRRAGSVVAVPSTERAVLQIQDFALEASRADVAYRYDILRRRVETVDATAAQRTGLAAGAEILAVTTLHLMNEVPGAYEERLINLATVPEARKEAFAADPPGTWLLRRVPWTDAEHAVRAVGADRVRAKLLRIETGAPCLLLERRTWQAGALVTEACITYPGDRHHLVGRFSPLGPGGSNGSPGS
jgi:GntR family histidine utilization transcriptional repressor